MKRAAIVAAALAGIVGLYLLVDLLAGESDEDRVSAIADTFEGAVTTSAIDAVLAHVDTTRAPLEIRARGMTRVYGAGAAGDIRGEAIRATSSYTGETLRTLRRSVTVEDDAGRIEMQMLSGRGTITLRVHTVKVDDTWFINRLQVSR